MQDIYVPTLFILIRRLKYEKGNYCTFSLHEAGEKKFKIEEKTKKKKTKKKYKIQNMLFENTLVSLSIISCLSCYLTLFTQIFHLTWYKLYYSIFFLNNYFFIFSCFLFFSILFSVITDKALHLNSSI